MAMIHLNIASEVQGVHLEWLEFERVSVVASSARLRLWSDAVVAEAIDQSATADAQNLRTAVRHMLRHGKFKASGRSKPAQEYLLRCALEEGTLPRINAPVDVLNTCSLAGGLPISLLSLAKCSRQLSVRYGRAGEAFVFNASGQLLDVEDLLVVCDASTEPSRPVGSPIKDSMAGKIEPSDTALVAIIYAPATPAGTEAAMRTRLLLAERMTMFSEARS